jgi:hypothetical protein
MNQKADYDELADAWWKTAKCMNAVPSEETSEAIRVWHSTVFEKILIQCGWTIEEWNQIVSEKTNKNELT